MRHVEVKPGEITTVSIAPPQSSLTVTSTEQAEVWLDGARVGDTPLESLPVAIGLHEIALRRAGAPDRKISVTVTTKPSTLNVDLSKPVR